MQYILGYQPMSDVPETRASKALKAKVEKDGQKSLVERSGVAQPTLSQLVNLKRQPGRKVAKMLEKIGIKQAWWDQPADGAAA